VRELGEALAAPPASTSSGSSASSLPPTQPTASSTAAAAGSSNARLHVPGSGGDGTREALAFPKVAVGGTFDHVHAGHRLLLAATALVATQEVFIGVTGGWSMQCDRLS
jgi:pantetheine-phosphate adenylyltransferase